LAKQSIVLHEGSLGPREIRLGRIFDFFGIPWQPIDVCELKKIPEDFADYVAFGSAHTVARVMNEQVGSGRTLIQPEAIYIYADDDRGRSTRSFQSLVGDLNLSLQEAPPGEVLVCVSSEMADLTGPMAGLKVLTPLRSEDAVLIGGLTDCGWKSATIISAGRAPLFLRFEREQIPIFFCTSSYMVDIDQPVVKGFYDIKDHFCSVVPLVMFIRFMFSDVAWRPQEIGACLIIDDPLLKPQYGFCNFEKLRNLMRQHGFTTNIAFIPWNWRRTSPVDSQLFRNESELFSVSIHGCDHIRGEFGATSREVLQTAAQLAQTRMQHHRSRTAIKHEPIMVFPQGVFSSICPEILKREGFIAAVNTELVPVDSQNARTQIRDVWDVAITTYGSFPIFTRRYAFHGLENFAFDSLLGKPCLIVAHHDFFKDGGAGLIELVEKIRLLNCRLFWRSLGEVIRRACRVRSERIGAEEVEMYGNELIVNNGSGQTMEVRIRKRKSEGDVVSEILCDEKPIAWATQDQHHMFEGQLGPRTQKFFRVVYEKMPLTRGSRRPLPFKFSVAVRRLLCEFRDEYVARSSFLSGPANRLKTVIRKAT
jgi:hypothetical protein